MSLARKRANTSTTNHDSNEQTISTSGAATGSGPGGTSTNFRNVSACNRCRHRKNRCDQQLPRCSACEKADTPCIGFDPVSKREIPRSYVYFLETRLITLESILREHNIAIPAPEESFPIDEAIKPGINVPFPPVEDGKQETKAEEDHQVPAIDPALQDRGQRHARAKQNKPGRAVDLRKTLPQTTMQPPGISFSKVVFAAVRSSVSHTPSEKGNVKPSKASTEHAAAHDCFFGLYIKPQYKPATFPDQETGLKLVNLYFEHANPQIPILHRGEFMTLFERVYSKPEAERSARELYLLKIVFAIGSGIIMDSSNSGKKTNMSKDSDIPSTKRQKIVEHAQPEEYHAAAVVHLEQFLSSSMAMEGHSGGMEELQAVLLLAALALLRPVAPGLWYIIGVAVRLAVDLGLHFEDNDASQDRNNHDSVAIGKRQWKRDLRRRLWWCVYSFDRLVSTCVGRPFGIADEVITTDFPSKLDDAHITREGFTADPETVGGPTYKLVSHHYFRLRLLQSEILQVLQYRQAQKARSADGNTRMHSELKSAFLHRFSSFRDWRADIDRRLEEWKDDAPVREDIGVSFMPLFLELNYWQAIIMLYRQSLAVPAPLADEMSVSIDENMQRPNTINHELEQDEQQVFLKIAQAGQMVIRTYRQLHRLKLVNYTFLATHHLFMSGISFLYALWHAPSVRSQMTLDDVDFTILAATSVLNDLIDKCPPAEACRDAFQRMSRATVSMCISDTGFGDTTILGSLPVSTPGGGSTFDANVGYFDGSSASSQPFGSSSATMSRQRRPLPAFDMNLDLLQQIPGNYSQAVRPAIHTRTTSSTSLPPIENANIVSPSNTSAQSVAYNSPVDRLPSLSSMDIDVQPSLSFDNLEFGDLSQHSWDTGFELDLGFGTGGTAGAYDVNHITAGDYAGTTSGGLDLFDGFFFGGNGGGEQ